MQLTKTILLTCIGLSLASWTQVAQAQEKFSWPQLGIDWSVIHFDRVKPEELRTGWVFSNQTAKYFDGEFASDSANVTSLSFTATDNINRNFARYYRYQLYNKVGLSDADETYLRLTGTIGWRLRSDRKRILSLPLTLGVTEYYDGGSRNDSISLRFSPQLQLPFGAEEQNTMRVQLDVEATRYANSPDEDSILVRFRPYWSWDVDDTYEITAGLRAERRFAGADIYSRSILGGSLSVIRKTSFEGAFLEFLVSYTHTKYDAEPAPPSTDLSGISAIAELSFNTPIKLAGEADFSVGIGIEHVSTFQTDSRIRSPYLSVGIRKRF